MVLYEYQKHFIQVEDLKIEIMGFYNIKNGHYC